jgi:hypothetical protein
MEWHTSPRRQLLLKILKAYTTHSICGKIIMGIAYLPLHYGRAPKWLFNRMVKLGRPIFKLIIDEYGVDNLLERLSDPYWFQALACCLGYDWHSSGVTTVLTGVIEKILGEEEYGLYIVGGKGLKSRKVPKLLSEKYLEILGEENTNRLIELSRLTAKVDTVLLQDGYNLYHHAIVFNDRNRWVIIQQGMNIDNRYARRYHILDKQLFKEYEMINEPHKGIIGDRIEKLVLDLTSKESIDNKKVMLDIIKERSFKRDYEELFKLKKDTLYRWIEGKKRQDVNIEKLVLPKRIDWNKVRKIYDYQPNTIPEFLKLKETTPKVVRAVSLVAELIYGERASWRDPIKYTFTVGGKDGIPYPVDRRTYDSIIKFFTDMIEASEMERKEKKLALKRITKLNIRNVGD